MKACLWENDMYLLTGSYPNSLCPTSGDNIDKMRDKYNLRWKYAAFAMWKRPDLRRVPDRSPDTGAVKGRAMKRRWRARPTVRRATDS